MGKDVRAEIFESKASKMEKQAAEARIPQDIIAVKLTDIFPKNKTIII